MFGMGTGSGSSLEPPGRRRTDLQAGFFSVCRHGSRRIVPPWFETHRFAMLLTMRASMLGPHPEEPCARGVSKDGPKQWAWEMRTIKIERAIRTGKLNASWSSALTHPAYQRGGLPRLLRENSF